MELRCLCGGHVYTLDELIRLSDCHAEHAEWAAYWPSVLGHGDLYCVDEDEVLTEEEVWRVRALKMPGHDPSGDPADWPDELVVPVR